MDHDELNAECSWKMQEYPGSNTLFSYFNTGLFSARSISPPLRITSQVDQSHWQGGFSPQH